MSVKDRPIVPSVRERDIDIQILQLVETSDEFRDWFIRQFAPNANVEQVLSISHSVKRIHGESDIELGIETTTGEEILILIENKIDASLQEDQAERYFKRGEKYVESGLCNGFEVGLLAPEGYVKKRERNQFGKVLTYESIRKQTQELQHDSTPFIRTLLDLAIEKQEGGPNSYPQLAQAIEEHFSVCEDEFPPLQLIHRKNNLVRFNSTDPDHPDIVNYSIWIQGPSEGKQTMVRLGIDSEAPDDEIAAMQDCVAEAFDGLDEFELKPDTTMWTVRTTVGTNRLEGEDRDEYVERIITELHKLVDHFHPRLISTTSGTSQSDNNRFG